MYHIISCTVQQELDSKKLKLKGILETHFHADFVSGHYELMQKTGTEVYFGPGAAGRCKFPVHEAHHNEVGRGGVGGWEMYNSYCKTMPEAAIFWDIIIIITCICSEVCQYNVVLIAI